MLKKTVLWWALGAFFVGVLFFALTNRWIVITIPFFHRTGFESSTQPAERKSVVFHLPRRDAVRKEARDVLYSSDPAATAGQVVKTWLNILDEEGLIEKKVSVQTAMAAHKDSVLFLSLDRSLLRDQFSTRDKLFVIESLLATLREIALPFKSVLFLVHHRPMDDMHLDFSQPWPIEGFLGNQIKKAPEPTRLEKLASPITIMLDPAGDAQQPGRAIEDSFERSVTLAAAQELKIRLEEEIPFCRVVLTRSAGDTLEPFQNATFANRLPADLFVGLNAFNEITGPATCALFYFVYNPVTDLWVKKGSALSFTPAHLSHTASLSLTIALAQKMRDALLVGQQKGVFKLANILGLPAKTLLGMQMPAVIIECGLAKKESLQLFIPFVVEGIKNMVEFLRTLAPVSQSEVSQSESVELQQPSETPLTLPF